MLSKLSRQYADSEIYAELDPLVGKWFKGKFKKFSPPQKYAVLNINKKRNTLISAPTGSGKTFSAFTAIISNLVSLAKENKLEDKVYCVYISPLKALNNDIHRNLKAPLEELTELNGDKLGIRVAVRTGDTTQSQRVKMLKKVPHILVTTPETLSILLVAPRFRELLKDVRWCIVDEIHSLACNKRGVHLAVSLERLQQLAGRFMRIGLSATIAPIEEVAEFLVGQEKGKSRDCDIVDVNFLKSIDMNVISPVQNLIDTTQGALDKATYNQLHNMIQEHKTTLIFTNTRSATERVVHNLKDKFPKHYTDNIAAHHSSLSKTHRLSTEEKLKQGELKAAVCSTSLELGIDIGSIDLVIMLGSPKSVSRALQRAGRSGHKLIDKIKGRFVVMDRDDLLECSLIQKNALERKIDKIDIPKNCLDVLAQHIYGFAIEGRNYLDNVYGLVKRAYPYRNLKREDFDSVIKYLAGDFAELEYRYVYAKIWYDLDTGEIGRRGKLARVLYVTNVGTIPDESYITVKIGDQSIGKIDEGFLDRLKKGDIFVLGGNTYQYRYCRGQTMQVAPTPNRLPTVPSWYSQMLPLNFDLALEIQRFKRLVEDKFKHKKPKKEILKFIKDYLYVSDTTADSVYYYLREQYDYAKISHDKRLLVENLYFDGKHYLVFHSCFGRRVNDAFSRALAFIASKMYHTNVAIGLTDSAFYLYADKEIDPKKIMAQLKKENLDSILKLAIDKTDELKRRFRHCAGRSLMILRNYKGRRKTVGRQQVSSQILINACKRISDDFPILKEARREVLEDLMDINNFKKVFGWIKNKQLKVEEMFTYIPSPFAINLIARGYSDILRMEDRLEFIKRMHNMVLAKISLKKK